MDVLYRVDLREVSLSAAFFSLILSFRYSASLRALEMRSAMSELIVGWGDGEVGEGER